MRADGRLDSPVSRTAQASARSVGQDGLVTMPIWLFTMARNPHARLERLACRLLAVDRVGTEEARQTMAMGAGLSLLRRCARRLPPQLKHEALCFFEPLELFRQRQARHAQELRTFVSVPARIPRVYV